jgi:ligand-binding SRPBCC domain-containing protein
MSWIHLDDVVSLLMAPLEDPKAPSVIHGVAPHPVRNSEFTQVLAKAMRKSALFPAPAVALRAALGAELAQVVLSSQRVRSAAPEGFQFRYPDLSLALGALCGPEAQGEHEIDVFQWVPQKPAEVFPFFSDERNLERITPEFLGFQVLKKSTPQIQEGTLIDYRLKIHGVPARWRTRIEEWVPGERFVDTQLSGPYKKWHHMHRFQSLGGGTLLRDTVRYVIPAGALGNLALGGLIQRDVQRIFGYRKKVIRELFGGV